MILPNSVLSQVASSLSVSSEPPTGDVKRGYLSAMMSSIRSRGVSTENTSCTCSTFEHEYSSDMY